MASDAEDDSTYRLVGGSQGVPTEVSYRLEVADGPDKGRHIDITALVPMPVIIGQSATAAFRLSDKTVSRQHAALTIEGARLRLVDRDSTNGTRVNGLDVKEAFLKGGETVALGDSTLNVTRTLVRFSEKRTSRSAFGRMLGSSEAMQRVYGVCDQAAASDVATLIEGEAGTGKDLLAECIHESSTRRGGPLVVVSLPGVPLAELERDLFGNDEVPSAFEEATGGTLVLDEIGELNESMQARLADVLRTKSLRRGKGAPIAVDARLISTSRRNLDHATERGLFNAELLGLAVGLRIELPPLRERKGDVPMLASHFSTALGGPAALAREQIAQLEEQRWPGNVRELQSYITRVAVRDARPTQNDEGTRLKEWIAERGLRADMLEDVLALDLPFSQAKRAAIAAFERRYVEHVLAQHRGNVSAASAASGIARRYFQMVKRRTGV